MFLVSQVSTAQASVLTYSHLSLEGGLVLQIPSERDKSDFFLELIKDNFLPSALKNYWATVIQLLGHSRTNPNYSIHYRLYLQYSLDSTYSSH